MGCVYRVSPHPALPLSFYTKQQTGSKKKTEIKNKDRNHRREERVVPRCTLFVLLFYIGRQALRLHGMGRNNPKVYPVAEQT